MRDELMHSNGTTPIETISVIIPSTLHIYITTLLVSLLLTKNPKNQSIQFLFEFLSLVAPIVLNCTVFSEYIYEVFILSSIAYITLIGVCLNIGAKKIQKPKINESLNFITNVRSTINLMSVIAILAVDFRIFPRKFAKTETFGYSLMDVGVGLYIYSNGIVSADIKNNCNVAKSLKSSTVLLILGAARFVLVKETDYQVPISEYGVHWNFFITLAFTRIFSTFVLRTIRVEYIFINAILLLTAHEFFLQCGLANFVLADTGREGLILANKEGLVSALGYVALYLFSVYFGYFLNLKDNHVNKIKIGAKLGISSALTLIISLILGHNFGVSRRLANSAYCFWILFIGNFMASCFFLGEIIQERTCKNKLRVSVLSPLIFDAINYNGLAFFLFCNLSTGLINLLCDTLKINDYFSLVIILFYVFTNCYIVCILYKKRIKLKF